MHKVLIVDDDPTLVDFLKLLLESEGYDTYEATDGTTVLERIAQTDPEIVLLDYMMPNVDGLDVLRNVSEHYESSFVVMLTGKGSEEVAVECMKAGAVDYVIKPFDNDRLLAVVRNVIRYREAELQKRKLNMELQQMNERLQKYIEELEKNSQKWSQKRALIDSFLSQCLSSLEQPNRTSEAVALLTRARNALK